jgi:hypothetical protein
MDTTLCEQHAMQTRPANKRKQTTGTEAKQQQQQQQQKQQKQQKQR